MEPVHPARMVAGNDVAVVDVAVLAAHERRRTIDRAWISRPTWVLGRTAAEGRGHHENAIAKGAALGSLRRDQEPVRVQVRFSRAAVSRDVRGRQFVTVVDPQRAPRATEMTGGISSTLPFRPNDVPWRTW